jgi:glyoxylase-like metal-dependent hydrolase (beta-lactamase superfamily II)
MSRIDIWIMTLALIAAPIAAQRPSPGEGPAHSENLGPGISSVNWGEPVVPRLKAEFAKISAKPVRLVINSHWHFDHVGDNEAFSKEARSSRPRPSMAVSSARFPRAFGRR